MRFQDDRGTVGGGVNESLPLLYALMVLVTVTTFVLMWQGIAEKRQAPAWEGSVAGLSAAGPNTLSLAASPRTELVRHGESTEVKR